MKLKSLNALNLKVNLNVQDSNHIAFGIKVKCVVNLQVAKIIMHNIVQFILKNAQFQITLASTVCNLAKTTQVNKLVKGLILKVKNVYGGMIRNVKVRV